MSETERYDLYAAWCRKMGIRPATFERWRRIGNAPMTNYQIHCPGHSVHFDSNPGFSVVSTAGL
jgi:hypothetical protein